MVVKLTEPYILAILIYARHVPLSNRIRDSLPLIEIDEFFYVLLSINLSVTSIGVHDF